MLIKGMKTHQYGSKNTRRVVYYFHGAGAHKHRWEDAAAKQFDRHWEGIKEIQRPLFVEMTVGPFWSIAKSELNYKKLISAEQMWQQIYAFEQENGLEVSDRIFMGHSMGSLNALLLALENPEQVQKMVLMAPALIDRNPLSFGIEHQKMTWARNRKQGLGKRITRQIIEGFLSPAMMRVFLGVYGNTKGFWPQFDGMARVKRHLAEGREMPELFLQIGIEDEFFDITREFKDLLEREGVKHEYLAVEGGHNALARDLEISEFILK